MTQIVRIHQLIREIFKGDENAAAAAVGKLDTLFTSDKIIVPAADRFLQKFKMATRNGGKKI